MKRISSYMKRYWAIYLLGTICLLGSLTLDIFNPVIAQRMIDEVILGGKISIFKSLILMLIGITVGRAILGYTKEMSFDYTGVRIISKLRMDLFEHIQSLSAHFFEQKNTGELMSRIKDDGEKVMHALCFGIMLVIEFTFSIVIATILMIQISPKLSILAIASIPVIGFFAFTLERKMGRTFGQISEQNAKLNIIAQENIAGVRLVKAFAREKFEINKFLAQNKEYKDLNMEQAKIWARFYPVLELLTNSLPILVVIIGGFLVIGEEMTIGTLVKFMWYMYMIIWPMRLMGWISSVIAEARASLNKIELIFNQQTTIVEAEDAEELMNFQGNIEFKNVGFTVGEHQVLNDISFDVKKGNTLAIMGETGSGKSTLINLLMRFYDKTAGEILLDGKSIEGLTLRSLRSSISTVMQDTFLFSDTIEENIKFGSKGLSMDKIHVCAKKSEVDEFVDRMEHKYQTVIGEKGIGLSGGQKQRISIARAFAKRANVLVFDDSTSALDMETEQKIQRRIQEMEGVTKIIIAHRISSVKHADEILILEKGEIVERGTHQELIALKGRYYETCREQYEGAHESHQIYADYDDFDEELA